MVAWSCGTAVDAYLSTICLLHRVEAHEEIDYRPARACNSIPGIPPSSTPSRTAGGGREKLSKELSKSQNNPASRSIGTKLTADFLFKLSKNSAFRSPPFRSSRTNPPLCDFGLWRAVNIKCCHSVITPRRPSSTENYRQRGCAEEGPSRPRFNQAAPRFGLWKPQGPNHQVLLFFVEFLKRDRPDYPLLRRAGWESSNGRIFV